jgi:hypothetical protein
MSATKPTANQAFARTTVAKRLTCPKCVRQNALSGHYELVAESGVLAGVRVEGSARECRYCGHVVGIRNHVPFGHKPDEGP